MKKKKQPKKDSFYIFRTSCSVCKECYRIPDGRGGYHDHCMFGGPYAGYEKVVFK